MDFFKSGLITARLKSDGTTDLVRDAFMIVVISGTSSDEHCFSSHVGIGSSSQVLEGATATSTRQVTHLPSVWDIVLPLEHSPERREQRVIVYHPKCTGNVG